MLYYYYYADVINVELKLLTVYVQASGHNIQNRKMFNTKQLETYTES